MTPMDPLHSLQKQIESIDPADIKKYELRETKTGELRLEKLGVATRLVRWLVPDSYDEKTVINRVSNRVHTSTDKTLHQGQLDFVLTKLLEKHVDLSKLDTVVQGVFAAQHPDQAEKLKALAEKIESCKTRCETAEKFDENFILDAVGEITAIQREEISDALVGHAKLHEARDVLLAELNNRLDNVVISKEGLQKLQAAIQGLDAKLGTKSRTGMELIEYRLSPAYEKKLIRAYTRKAHAFLRNPARHGPEFIKAVQNHRTYLGSVEFEKRLQHPRMQLLKAKALAKARDTVSNPLTIGMNPKIPKKPPVDLGAAPESAKPLLEKWVPHIPDPQAAHNTLWRASNLIRCNGEPLRNELTDEAKRETQCIEGPLNIQYQVSLLCEELFEKAHKQFPDIDVAELRAVIGEAVCVRAIQYNPVDAITSLFNETYSAFFEPGDSVLKTEHGFNSDRGYQFAFIQTADDGKVACRVIAHGETGFGLKSGNEEVDKFPELSIITTAYRKIIPGKTWQGVVELKKP